MLEFMDYVQTAFHARTAWNPDNSYAALTRTADNLLAFPVPQGLRLNVSSLSSQNFATSYTLGAKGVVDGNLSFLYSSLALQVPSRSAVVGLESLVRGYRRLAELKVPGNNVRKVVNAEGKTVERKDTLLYGRLYLPTSTLEALFLRRISPTRLLRLNCVSDSNLPAGGTLLAVLQNDYGKYTTEYLYSTDSSLLGVRGLYNFGYDPREPKQDGSGIVPSPYTPQLPPRSARHPWDHQNGRLSLGAEAYFSPLNKSGGLSTGLRFTTLPVHSGFPYTMTLTLNPLMGNLSSAYAVQAGPNLSLCSRFDFNVYSYESDVELGLELWRRKLPTPETEWARQMMREGWDRKDEEVTGVVKARVSDKGKVGLVWEGRMKELLVTLGAGLDLRRRERVVGRVGCEVAFST